MRIAISEPGDHSLLRNTKSPETIFSSLCPCPTNSPLISFPDGFNLATIDPNCWMDLSLFS